MPVITKALLYVCIDSHFTEMIRVARMMKASGRYEPVFFFEFQYGVVERDLAVTRGEGFECLVPSWFRLAPAIPTAGPVAGNGGEAASAAAPPFAADSAYASLHSRIGRILPTPVRLAWRKLLARLSMQWSDVHPCSTKA